MRCHVPGNYFLKELGIGEYDMPIAGMLSVSDGSELEEDHSEWAAREWFDCEEGRGSHGTGRDAYPARQDGG